MEYYWTVLIYQNATVILLWGKIVRWKTPGKGVELILTVFYEVRIMPSNAREED